MKNTRHFGKAFLFWASTFLLIIIPGSYAIAQTCISPPSGLVSWWPGDGDAADIEGSNNGVLENGATFAPGFVSQAFLLNGVDDFVAVPDSNTLDIARDMTIDAWVNLDSFRTEHNIVSKDVPFVFFTNYNLHIFTNKVFFSVAFADEFNVPILSPQLIPSTTTQGVGGCDTGGCFLIGASDFQDGTHNFGTWRHIAAVYEDGPKTMKVYLDGVLDGEVSFDTQGKPYANDLTLQIGRRKAAVSSTDGLIDEVELFNRALLQSEIQAIFNAGSAGKCKTIAPIAVSIDIKPNSDPNSINPRSKGKIPVAILTTIAGSGDPLDFDATQVDALSVEFGPDEASEAHGRAHIDDVDNDGDMDMLLHFKTKETGIGCGDTEASLTGVTFSGDAIEGSDSINTVGCK